MKRVDIAAMGRAELETFAYETSIENDELKLRVRGYEEQAAIANRRAYSQKSEPTPDQLSFFNEAEAEADPDAVEPALEKVHPPQKPKKKEKGSKDKMLAPLAKERVEYRLSQEEQVCPECGGPLHQMKKEIRRELTLIPARVEVKESVIYSYSCRTCDREGTVSPVVRCDAPPLLLRNSLVSPSMAAHIICRKYENRDPLQKISNDFRMMGLKLSRQTLANWVCRLSEKYLAPMTKMYRQELKKQVLIHADETEVQVLNEPDRTAQQKSRMWVFCSGEASADDPDVKPIRHYVYDETRKREVAENYLEGYRGFLQSDGYIVYHTLHPGIIDVGCMAHVRRKYYDAVMVLPQSARERSVGPVVGLGFCDELIALDQKRKKLKTDREKEELKEKKIRPLLTKFFRWAEREYQSDADGKTYRSALQYTVNQKEYLNNYLKDGRIEMTNNAAERAIKPFVLGRKNWLFSNTPRGAEASAAMYSIVETAKLNGLKPMEYITWILEEMRGKDPGEMELADLLPWSKKIPDECWQPKIED